MKRTKRKIKNTTILLPILAALAFVVVFLTIEAATSGAQIAQLEQEEAVLTKQSRELSDKLVKASSLITLGEEAEVLGFKKPSQIIYITEKEVVAKLP